MDISGKVAILTGGASGLGLATVRKLASEGARAVILDLPSSEGKRVAEELGAGAVFVAADVIDPHQVQAADPSRRSDPDGTTLMGVDSAPGAGR